MLSWKHCIDSLIEVEGMSQLQLPTQSEVIYPDSDGQPMGNYTSVEPISGRGAESHSRVITNFGSAKFYR